MSSPFDTTFIQETFLVNRRPTQTSIASRGLRRLASLRKRASVPSLGSAFRQSVDALGNTFHGLREGLYEEGNEKWQQKEQTRQILHARMREVSMAVPLWSCDSKKGSLLNRTAGNVLQGVSRVCYRIRQTRRPRCLEANL